MNGLASRGTPLRPSNAIGTILDAVRLFLASVYCLPVHLGPPPRPTAFPHPSKCRPTAPPARSPTPHPPAPPQPTLQQPPPDCQSSQQRGPSAGRRGGAWPGLLAAHPGPAPLSLGCWPPGQYLPVASSSGLSSTSWHHSNVLCFFSDKMLLVWPAAAETCAAAEKVHGLTM